MRISAIKNAEGDFIEGRLASRNLNRFNAEFVVQIPRELELVKVETRGGSLNFSSMLATVLGATGAGSVKLDDLDGSVKITSGGGNVEVGRLGSDFSLTTGGGDVHIKNIGGQTHMNIGGGKVYVGSTKGADIQTGAGNIEVRKCNGDLAASLWRRQSNSGRVNGAVQAETTGGSVHLDSAKGRVQVTTGGGSVELFNLGQGAKVETGAGGITAEFVGKRGTFSDSSLHTAAGDVVVFLPRDLPVTVHASVRHGDRAWHRFRVFRIADHQRRRQLRPQVDVRRRLIKWRRTRLKSPYDYRTDRFSAVTVAVSLRQELCAKIRYVMRALIAMLLAGAMAAPAAAMSPGSPAWSDPHETAYLGVHIDEVTPQQSFRVEISQSERRCHHRSRSGRARLQSGIERE